MLLFSFFFFTTSNIFCFQVYLLCFTGGSIYPGLDFERPQAFFFQKICQYKHCENHLKEVSRSPFIARTGGRRISWFKVIGMQ